MDNDSSDVFSQLLQRIDKLESEMKHRDILLKEKDGEIQRLLQQQQQQHAATPSAPASSSSNATARTSQPFIDTAMSSTSSSPIDTATIDAIITSDVTIIPANQQHTARTEQLYQVSSQLQTIEQQKASVDSDYIQAMQQLVQRAEQQGRETWLLFQERVKAQNEALRQLRQHLRKTLKAQYIEVNALKLDELVLGDKAPHLQSSYQSSNRFESLAHTSMFTKHATFQGWRIENQVRRQRWAPPMHHSPEDMDDDGDFVINSATSNSMSLRSSQQTGSIKLDKHAADTAFFQTIEEMQQEKRATASQQEYELNNQMRKQQQQRIVEQRAEMAVTQILPLVPHFSVEQCVTALKMHHDNAERTVEYLLTKDIDVVTTELALQAQHDSMSNGSNGTTAAAASTTSTTLSLQRSGSSLQRASKTITFRVVNVDQNTNNIELEAVLDRNRIAIDTSKHAATLQIPIQNLLQLDIRLPTASDVVCIEQDIADRRLQLTYSDLTDNEYEPLKLEPAGLKITDYAVDHVSSQGVRSVTHVSDGPVLYSANKYSGTNPLAHTHPTILYTQVMDDHTVNVVHLHIDDTSEDITVDSTYLTEPVSSVLQSAGEFKRDAAGRQLSYKIVCSGQKVVGVLHAVSNHNRKSNEVQELRFEERRVPAVGQYVQLPGNRVARVESMPIGLIVSAHQDPAKLEQYSKQQLLTAADADAATCSHKHPADMHGNVRLTVLMEGSAGLLQPASLMLPLCRLTPIADQQAVHQQVTQAQQHAVASSQAALPAKLQQLEQLLQQLPQVPTPDQLSQLEQLKQEVVQLSQVVQVQSVAASLQPRIAEASATLARRTRAAALDRRRGSR